MFVLYSVGYKNTSKAVTDHCREGGVTKRYTPTESGEQEMTYINEGNLYRLIIKSRKPEAAPFESWVCDEVLPSIRKTGRYDAQTPAPASEALPGRLSAEQQAMLQRRVEKKASLHHYAESSLWASLHDYAGVDRTQKIPIEHFGDVIRYVDSLKIQIDAATVNLEQPSAPRALPRSGGPVLGHGHYNAAYLRIDRAGYEEIYDKVTLSIDEIYPLSPDPLYFSLMHKLVKVLRVLHVSNPNVEWLIR